MPSRCCVSSPLSASLVAQRAATYFPPPGQWQTKSPAELGFDAAKLKEAVDYALSHGSTWDFDKDQVRTFGTPLGPLPKQRASTNGIILRHGYIVAQFGDTKANDPVYSVAKSFLSTVAGVAVERGLIKNVNDRVGASIHDGGYDSPHNAMITWKNHLQQESEWEGTLWGKNADFVGHEQFGAGERKPRAIQNPGTFYEYNDVRINRFSLSLLRLFGIGLPDVLKTAIMDPIGASHDWRWVPYDNSQVEINGKTVGSVSGGTRWGGGLWINSEDLARFGLLVLNHGRWNDEAARAGAVVQGRGDAERARTGLRLPLVAEHEAAAVAERAGVELCRARERIEHDLDRSRARHRVRLALVREPRDGRHDSAHRRVGASRTEQLPAFVGRRPVDRRQRNVDETNVHGELPAVVNEMVEVLPHRLAAR